ncbi:Centromere protein 3 [Tolypocladium ophioglossoides CBS 100239]|uniref:CENP-C homolog n=1 Tax=Tolypocladium ophioglossoides (strain CBS 100239) TaxID=1163406 RepID=A0A0L0NJD9_TOLOC|nr:Centromere protein 3 [Tolypocladium ophioglossoides CBS 100239]
MAPRARRGEAAEPQAFHELGVRGRKTGVFLPDGGERDEHGMPPLETIFSSPQKAAASTSVADDSGSEDMEIASSGGPGPRTLLRNQRNIKLPIPKSRSPIKTSLKSPARKNPLVERLSSPTRRSIGGERDVTVTRRLDFTGRTEKSRNGSARGKANGVNGTTRHDSDDDDDDSVLAGHLDVEDMMEESLQMVDAMGTDDDGGDANVDSGGAPEEEPEEEPDEDEPPVKRRRGRPPRQERQNEDLQASRGSKKRRSLKNSTGGDDVEEPQEEEEDEELRQAKKQRTKAPPAPKAAPVKAAPATTAAAKAKATKHLPAAKADNKPKARPGRKAKVQQDAGEEAGESSFVALQRGPPMPKSRGLVSVRRDADAMKQTRSGRHSYKPVDYWRGEQIIREDEERNDMFYDGGFVLPTIKEIVRVPQDEPPSKRAPRSNTRTKAKVKHQQAVEEDEEPEEWEMNPGTVTGEIVLWEPEHEEHPPGDDEPVQVIDDRIAISADAIQTSDIKDATFRFAKTLTMPFMGAGIVDLPPGSEKRPKNSRKMHMVFFVHYGKVLVTINEVQFRISAGGTWFVPRGNYYSITNDYDNPSRIFFAQASEVQARLADSSQEQSTVALGY